MTKKAIILKGARQNLKPVSDLFIISNEELRNRLVHLDGFLLCLRFSEVKLLTYRLDTLVKPLGMALIIRFLSRGACYFEDEKGKILEIDIKTFAALFIKTIKDWIEKRRLLPQVSQEIKNLREKTMNRGKIRVSVDLLGSPIYLRTDLIFGLCSGGSVGHIAGVLNHLDHFTAPPVFLSTDIIPTVRPDIETKILTPPGRFWDFNEVPGIFFNTVMERTAKEYLDGRRISFVYQRYSLNNYCGVKIAQLMKVPFVLEYNGSEIWINRNWGRPLRYEALSEKIEMLNLRAADLVVVVSHVMKEELLSHCIQAEKILVNPNGVDPDRYSPSVDGTKIRSRYHLDEKVVVGFIGTFGKWHGAEVLAEAFGLLLRQFPEYKDRVRLLMIGDGLMMPLVKKTIIQLAVAPHCILTGLIPQEEGPEHLAACDILVASHVPNPDGTPFFGSPTKLFEYMAMGKGIVASDLNQIGEVLKHDYTAWLVKPGDIDSLMIGLKTLIDDEPRRVKLGKAAREEVVAKYTWKEHTRKIIEKLKERCG